MKKPVLSFVEGLTAREQVLVTLGPFVALALGHVFLRLLPERQARLRAESDAARLEALVAAPAPARDPEGERLAARRSALRASVERERAQLAQLERSFPRDEGAVLEAASELASRSDVLVRESSTWKPANDGFSRPRRRFVLVARFEALRSFVAGLATLPAGPLRVERFELEAVPLAPNDTDPETSPGRATAPEAPSGHIDGAGGAVIAPRQRDPRVLVASLVVVL